MTRPRQQVVIMVFFTVSEIRNKNWKADGESLHSLLRRTGLVLLQLHRELRRREIEMTESNPS